MKLSVDGKIPKEFWIVLGILLDAPASAAIVQIPKQESETTLGRSRGETRRSCPRGYELRRVGKRMMCVKR